MPLFKVQMKMDCWQEVVVEADDHREAMFQAENGYTTAGWESDPPYALSSIEVKEEKPNGITIN